jgi:hypothetical protein
VRAKLVELGGQEVEVGVTKVELPHKPSGDWH